MSADKCVNVFKAVMLFNADKGINFVLFVVEVIQLFKTILF